MKPEHYEYIKEKYEDLFHSIANNISGDFAVSHDDNVQAMWLAVYDAIDGFSKQDNGKNGTIDDFIKTKGFNKYLKTVLWNYKNKFGAATNKKYPFQRDAYSIHSGPKDDDEQIAIMNITDKSQEWAITGELAFKDFVGNLGEEEKLVLDAILDNPHHMMGNGKINIKAVSNLTNISTFKVKKIFGGLRAKVACVNQ